MSPALSRRSFLRAAGLVATGTTVTLVVPAHDASASGPARAGGAAGSEVPVAWVRLVANRLVHTEQLPPPVAARLFAYTTIALHEAVVGAGPHGWSLAGGLNGLPAMPVARPRGRVDAAAAASAAARAVVLGLLGPTVSAAGRAAVDELERRQQQRWTGRGAARGVLANSQAYGEHVAAAVVRWAQDDGFTVRRDPFVLRTGEGLWELAPPASAAVLPYWGMQRPLALHSAQEVVVPLPPAYSAAPDSPFATQARHVYDVSRTLTDEHRAIARFWAPSPAMRWMTIAADQVEDHDLRLHRGTLVLALTAVAIADAAIAAWARKYEYVVMRPVTYIQRHIDAGWAPLLPTPGHPEYPAGHSASASAAATVLTALFGDVPVTARDTTGTEAARHLPSFQATADESSISRVYAGVHYPVGLEAGDVLGRRTAELVLQRLARRRGRRHPWR